MCVGVQAGILGWLDPTRADMVALLGEVTGAGMPLARLVSRIQLTDEGLQLLAQKPRITQSTLQYASTLPPGSFGYAYSQFMNSYGYSPAERPNQIQFLEDKEQEYVLQRYRQVHDLWHVLVGLPTSVEGELAQKWFEFLQTGLPLGALSVVIGQLKLGPVQIWRLNTIYIPWAFRCHFNCKFLLALRLENRFPLPLEQVRKSLGIERAPVMSS